MSVQPKMIMAFLPGGGYRIGLVNHERIKASQADLPGSRQPGRASADDHDMLIHGASVYPSPPAVNKNYVDAIEQAGLTVTTIDYPRPLDPAAWSTDEASTPSCIVIGSRKAA